jgi:hypothetical protein
MLLFSLNPFALSNALRYESRHKGIEADSLLLCPFHFKSHCQTGTISILPLSTAMVSDSS